MGEGSTYFFASATARARMARFFSSTLMRFTETAGAIGAPGPAPPIFTEVGPQRHAVDVDLFAEPVVHDT